MKFIKRNYKFLLGIVVGLLITGGGVYAATIAASSISYSNSSSKISSTNVQGAIDELYKKAGNQYFDLSTAKANKTGKVFASKKGVCISRNKKVYCFKVNNYDVEKTHIQEVFSDVGCNVDSDDVDCTASDFNCNVNSYGTVHCSDQSASSYCRVYSSGLVSCN